jgi:HK97 family phage portal protein
MASAGTVVNDDSALSIMTFYAGCRIISDSVSQTDIRAVKETKDGMRVPVRPRPAMITDAFDEATIEQGNSQITMSLILRGNAYIYATDWDATGKMTHGRILNPDQVRVRWDKKGQREYEVNGNVVPAWRMTHLTGMMLPGALTGVGIVEYCRNALGLGIALDDVAGEFFRNGIMSTGVIGVDTPLTPDEARAASEQFQSLHSGVRRANLPIVMSGGAKYTPLTLSPDDAQFLQSRQFFDGGIATMLGIPPHLLGIVDRTTSWGTGIEVQGRAFVDYTLKAYYHRLEGMYSSWLPDGMYAEFVTDALTRADTQTRYGNWMKALGGQAGPGWMNIDEVRAREGMPPLPDGQGQAYFVPATAGADSEAPAAPLPSDDPNTGDPNGGDEN